MSVSPTSASSGGGAQAAQQAAQQAALAASKALQAGANKDADAAQGDPDHDAGGPERAAQPTAANGSPVAGSVLALNAANTGGAGISAAAASAAYQKAS